MSSDKPILFSVPMIRAILDGSKTQTRRIVKPQPTGDIMRVEHDPDSGFWLGDTTEDVDKGYCSSWARRCPFGQPGDRLWVRETYALLEDPGSQRTWDGQIPDEKPTTERTQLGHVPTPIYGADGERSDVRDQLDRAMRWRPGIHMPRWASRITLEVTGVRIERVQDISEEDARAEGVEPRVVSHGPPELHSYRLGFKDLWRVINGPESWTASAWVWVISFKRVKP